MTPYYDEDGITIYHGDCRDIIPTLAFNVVVTDPPYGVEFKGKSTKHSSADGGYGLHHDTMEYVCEVVVPIIESLRPISDRVVLTPGQSAMFRYPEPDHVGAIYYPSGSGVSSHGFVCWQPIYTYGHDAFAGKGSRPDSFHTTDNASDIKGHPCPKPLSTMSWLLARSSINGEDVILDPFMGSGTTLRAAKDLGRQAIGIELEERYCEIAATRLAQGVLDFGAPA